MMRQAMRARLLPQASLGWLVAHELRLATRAAGRRITASRWAGYAILAVYVAFGCFLGWSLRDVPIRYSPLVGDLLLAAAIGVFSFMTSQAVLGSQMALYGAGDLDLLLTAPIPERTVLRAKMLGIVGAISLTYAILLMPLALPVALLGHPALLGSVALLAAMAMVAACLGLALTLTIARVAGPRAARTAGQVMAALVGGAVFLATQLTANSDRLGGRGALYRLMSEMHLGEHGPGALPGRMVFGDPLAIAIGLGGAVALFALTSTLFQRHFLTSYQAAAMRLSRPARHAGDIRRHFRAGLLGAVFAKELLLLRRDPALLFQIVLRLVYLAPLALVALGGRHPVAIAPMLAFASVLVVGQLVGSLSFLTISAEDAPDLLSVAPVEREQVDMAKLLAALAMAAPIGLILPVVEATQTLAGGLLTLFLTAVAGALSGLIELKLGKPTPRAAFNRRRTSNGAAGILAGIVALLMGGVAALGVYALG